MFNLKNKTNKKFFVVIFLLPIGVLTSMIFLPENTEETSVYDGPPKALILDQLYSEIPNEQFHVTAKNYLEIAGYEVDIVKTENVTIDFYKELPSMNYQFVVVRTHGLNDELNPNGVALFTGEKYREDKYTLEQLNGQIKKGTPLLTRSFQQSSPDSDDWIQTGKNEYELKSPAKIIDTSEDEYFLISSKFVKESMTGKFSDTIFFLGGCETMEETSMAESFVNRGASLVVGWDNPIGSVNNDVVMLNLLKNYLLEEQNIEQAIASSVKVPFVYQNQTTNLSYYPIMNS